MSLGAVSSSHANALTASLSRAMVSPQGSAAQAPRATPATSLSPSVSSNAAVKPGNVQLAAAVDQVASAVQGKASDLRFSIDESSGKTVVRILDVTTGETLRQIPSAEMLELAKSIDRMQGLLLQQKV